MIVDSLNGFFLEHGTDLYISLLYKNIWIALILFRLLQCGKVGIVYLLMFYISIIYLNLSLNSVNSDIPFTSTFIHLFKFLSTIILFFYFKSLIQIHGIRIYPAFKNIFLYNGLVICISILLGPFGFGYRQYGDTWTFRGFFYAGNELSGALLLIVPFMLYQLLKFSRKYYYICSLIFLLIGVLIGTKTGLLAVLVSIFAIPYLVKKNAKTHLLVRYGKFLLILFLLTIVVYMVYTAVESSGIFSRWEFMFSKGGIIHLIFSGRNQYWAIESRDFFDADFFNKLLGLGGNRTVEMDIHDTVLNYGYVGILIVYGFFLSRIIAAYRYHTQIGKVVVFTNILFLFASSLSGHLIYSATANIFLALNNSLIYFDRKI